MFFSLIISLFVLSLLVFVHEFGHFLAAKKSGIKVEEFGLGYPPRLLGVKKRGTIYSINLIPFGGFVSIYGMEESEKRKTPGLAEAKPRAGKNKNAFWNKSKRIRAIVLLAGILMNFLLGVVSFSLIYSVLGIPEKQGFVEVAGVAENSPAEKAGMQEKDIVISVISPTRSRFATPRRCKTNQEFIEIINQNLGQEIELELEREGERRMIVLVPRKEPPESEGPLGVAIVDSKTIQPVFWQRPFLSLWWGFKEAVGWMGAIFFGVAKMIYELLFKKIIPQDVTGPVGIVQVTSNVAKAGILPLLQFIGVLSVNLSVLNLLPIPALDGSRLLFLAVEAVTGKKPKPKTEKLIHALGMIVLLFLMLLITVQDVSRIFRTSVSPF